MRSIISMSFIMLAGLVTSCGPSLSSRYPSYKQVVSKYAPAGDYQSIKAETAAHHTPDEECDCPRIWYQDRWVYYFEGHWFYRHHGFWYTYPVFYVHYIDGAPHVYRRDTRSIRKGSRNRSRRELRNDAYDSSSPRSHRDNRNGESSRTTTHRSIRKGNR